MVKKYIYIYIYMHIHIENTYCHLLSAIRCLDLCLVTLMRLNSNTENTCGAKEQASSQKSNVQSVASRTVHAKSAYSNVLVSSKRVGPSKVVSTLVSSLVVKVVHHRRRGGTHKKLKISGTMLGKQ